MFMASQSSQSSKNNMYILFFLIMENLDVLHKQRKRGGKYLQL